MKKQFFLFCLTLLTASLFAQEEGIKFNHDSWADIKKQAAKENKYIFMDCYTTWCGPCKAMAKNIFPLQSVGVFYNKYFINVKMDMEKGEGPGIAQANGVTAYPTYLFFNPQGELVHRGVGMMPEGEFTKLAEVALDTNQQFVRMERLYEKGNRDSKFLYKYAYACKTVMNGKEQAIALDYLKTQKDYSSVDNKKIIFDMIRDVNSEPFKYMAQHKADFVSTFGEDNLNNILREAIARRGMELSINNGNKVPQEQIKKLYSEYYPKEAGIEAAKFTVAYYLDTEQWEDFAPSAIKYIEEFKIKDPSQLNLLAWAFFLHVDNKKQLDKALDWSKTSVDKEPSYYNLDTLARLYAKTGNKSKAIKFANKAIEKAKQDGSDYTETDNFLKTLSSQK